MSDRHQRVESLIRELVASYIQKEANTDPLITITRVTSSPDYRRMTAFFTTIPDGREDDALIFLKRTGSDLRSYIKKKSNLKIIPFLEFSVDYDERHRQHIDEIARDIEEE
ncbi:MAG: ribosome-binding factor A [Candidatus Paceibacterota bacterium]